MLSSVVSALDGVKWSKPRPGRFTPTPSSPPPFPGKTGYPLYRKQGGPEDQSGLVHGFDSRTIQPVASLYPGPQV